MIALTNAANGITQSSESYSFTEVEDLPPILSELDESSEILVGNASAEVLADRALTFRVVSAIRVHSTQEFTSYNIEVGDDNDPSFSLSLLRTWRDLEELYIGLSSTFSNIPKLSKMGLRVHLEVLNLDRRNDIQRFLTRLSKLEWASGIWQSSAFAQFITGTSLVPQREPSSEPMVQFEGFEDSSSV